MSGKNHFFRSRSVQVFVNLFLRQQDDFLRKHRITIGFLLSSPSLHQIQLHIFVGNLSPLGIILIQCTGQMKIWEAKCHYLLILVALEIFLMKNLKVKWCNLSFFLNKNWDFFHLIIVRTSFFNPLLYQQIFFDHLSICCRL